MESDPLIVSPGQITLAEHVPEFVSTQDLEDLSTFTGLSPEDCLERLRSYSTNELAVAWTKVNPSSPDEILDFYKSTDLYIWALMQWHTSQSRQPYRDALSFLARNYPANSGWRNVCDFGCGIGTDALFLAKLGYQLTLVDVDSPTFRFAKHRFARRGIPSTFVESDSPLPVVHGEFDVVVCFDVFEHLPDPLRAAASLVKGLRSGGLLVQQGSFMDEGQHPCHLAAGVHRFGGLKWHIYLAGLGLRAVASMVYAKTRSLERFIQVSRFKLWRLTGLWISRVKK